MTALNGHTNGVTRAAARLAERGVVIDAGEIQTRLLRRAADHFGLAAKGAPLPAFDPFVAGMLAEILAKLAGVDVPKPIKGAVVAGVTAGGKDLPEATTVLLAKGYKRVKPVTRLVFSQFLANPNSVLATADLARMSKLPAHAVSQVIYGLHKFNCVKKIGKGLWRNAT